DDLGLHFVEGGWPGSNPKDAEFFARMKHAPLRRAVLTAFSSTRRAGAPTEQDLNIRALLDAETPGVTFVGKSWDLHVTRVINTHNDCELAVANSIAALQAGAVQVQGTVNGYGERCGNANICSIIPLLQVKMGVPVLRDDQLARLTELSGFVSELANLRPDPR